MKKNTRYQYARMSDQEMSDLALSATLKTPTLSQVEGRATRILEELRDRGTKAGKQCTKNSRCGNLGCAICRRRIQLALIAVYAPPLVTALKSKKKGGA